MDLRDTLLKISSDAKNAAEKLAKGAVDGGKKVAEKVKISNTISQAESRLNATYQEIGRKYEEVHGADGEEAFAELLAELAETKSLIEVSRAELAAVNSAAVCPNCGKFVQEGQNFCPNCGAKQPEKTEDIIDADAEDAAKAVEDAVDAVKDAAEEAVEEIKSEIVDDAE